MTTLNTQELTLIAQIIDMASTRGTFKANELLAVGSLHKRIVELLQAEEKEKNKFQQVKDEKEKD
tara:strand:+ start:1023 stop:1217 length:195 start_codon:yes stop_codon:yes gene_type:complete